MTEVSINNDSDIVSIDVIILFNTRLMTLTSTT